MSGNGRSLLRSSLLRPSVLENFMKPWSELMEDKWPYSTQLPAVNVKETDKNFEITLAAPRLQKDDFKIDVNGSMITISAEKDEEKEEKEENYTRREYSYSSFSRSFRLPENILQEKIDANYFNGELKLLLPKKKEARKTAHQKISVH